MPLGTIVASKVVTVPVKRKVMCVCVGLGAVLAITIT